MERAGWLRSVVAALVIASGSCLSGCAGPEMLYESRGDLSLSPFGGLLIRVTESGVVPDAPIRVAPSWGGVVFLNDTRDRLVSVRFPHRRLKLGACNQTKTFAHRGGSTFTVEPLAPGAAAGLCVHDPGEVPFEVHGLRRGMVRGTLVIAPWGAK